MTWNAKMFSFVIVALLGCASSDGGGSTRSDGSGGSTADLDGGTSSEHDASGATVSFARDVFPIVQRAGCASESCHSDTSSPTAHFTDYRTLEGTYDQWTQGGGFDHCSRDGGPSISVPPAELRLIAGNPDASLLIRKLTETRDACSPFYGRMPPPPRPRLSPDEIETIRTWIREGAQNN